MKRLTYLCLVGLLLASAAPARADIFQWEYINPDNPAVGKQQSTTLCPDGAGVNAEPGVYLVGRNLTMAYLIGANLNNATFVFAALTGADLSGANLTGADIGSATLTDANFAGAQVRGVDFAMATYAGFTAAQLYSTASYQGGDLSEIRLGYNDLSGWNFAGKNLTNAIFYEATLWGANLSGADLTNADFETARMTDANFIGARVRGANFRYTTSEGFTAAQLYSTASYQEGDLSGIRLGNNNLSGWNFAGKNLTNADFGAATLTDANFAGAQVRGAYFPNGTYPYGFTAAQLYSTASYQEGDLSGIRLVSVDLSGWNFSGKNLTNADFYFATLTGANFAGARVRGANFGGATYYGFFFTPAQLYSTASYQEGDLSGIGLSHNDLSGWNFAGKNLTNADFYAATLTGADFTGADTRGALGLSLPGSAIITNLIRPDGHLNSLHLDGGGLLVVRDYDGNPNANPPTGALPIVVDQHFVMGAGGTLRTVFEADAWDSTISFAAGIPVARGGTLELTFADGVSLSSQIGRTFDVFDWTGVMPTGAFAVASPYVWDLSKLHATGEVTFLAAAGLPGDFNNDSAVDGADYVVWRKGLSTATYTQAAYNVWRGNLGTSLGAGSGAAIPSATPLSPAVPEPATLVLLFMGMLSMCTCRRGSVVISYVFRHVPNLDPFKNGRQGGSTAGFGDQDLPRTPAFQKSSTRLLVIQVSRAGKPYLFSD